MEKNDITYNLYLDLATYVDPYRVEQSVFLLDEIPEYHPLSLDYREFWKEQRKRCIEGYWYSGVWMPGKLYFYVNFNTIKRNFKGSKVKQFARPLLRDVEWMVYYNVEEARGFSGFEDDPIYSCHNVLTTDLTDDQIKERYCYNEDGFSEQVYNNIFQTSGVRKIYQAPREYLRKVHDGNYGVALYLNNSKNMLTFGSREFGKSYIAGNITLHEWLFDGLTRYVPANQVNTAADIIMGAFDAKYSGETLDKAKIGLDKLPGGYETYEFKYPAPFTKKYTGSWGPSKSITAQYKKKVKGTWEDVGTKSIIRHRTFKDNPFAGQGSRNGLIMCEEIGMWPNFLECFAAMVDNQKDGSLKFGSMFMWGTGGSMDQGIVPALDIFYNPQKYDCIVFEDIWENKGEICFFMPAYLALNNTKDTSGKTLMGLALSEIHTERDKLAGNKGSKDRLQREMQYRPIKPSEMFLTKTGNYFPIVEMKERLALLDSKVKPEDWQKKVQLYFDPNVKGGVRYEIDTTNSLTAIDKYPWHGPSKDGCVVIYEFPITDKGGVVPKDLYLIGHDPIATDSVTGESFAATYVIKTKKYWQQYGHDEIVAAYVSRPYDGRGPINENLLKLSMLYGNALIYFENMVGNVKEYFEKMKRLDLLARQPTTVFNKKASFDGKGQAVVYGYPMSNRKIKMDAVQYVRDWLLEERGQEDGRIVRNLDRIWDKALLQELIAFDLDGNFDRVMGLMGCIIGLNETHNQYQNSIEAAARDYNANSLSFLLSNRLIGGDNYQETKTKLKSVSIDFSSLKF